MNELKCQFANHQEKKIITICLHKECKDNRLCCLRCVSQFHGGHDDQLIEVEQFNDFMKTLSKQGAPQSYTYAQNQLIQGLEQLCKLILSLQKIVQERLQEIKGQNLQNLVNNFNNKQQGIDSFKEFIENILKYVESNNGKLSKKQQYDGQLNQIESQQISIIQKSELVLIKIIQSFDIPLQPKQFKFNKIPIELIGHQDKVMQAIISQDGTLIVSRSNDKTIKIWNAKSKQILQTIQLTEIAQRMALSSNNQYLAYYYFGQIRLHNIKKNKHFGIPNISNLESMVFSLDVKYLLFGGLDKKIIICDLVDMKQVHIFETYENIQMINISPDNKLISYLTGQRGKIQIWDLQTKVKLIQETKAHEDGYSLCSSADSSIYVTSGVVGPVKIWKLNQLQDNKYSLTLTLQIEAGSKYVDTLLTTDNQYIISMCNQDGRIMIYERESGRLIQELCSGEKSNSVSSISMSNDMKVLVSTNFTNNIKVWTRE